MVLTPYISMFFPTFYTFESCTLILYFCPSVRPSIHQLFFMLLIWQVQCICGKQSRHSAWCSFSCWEMYRSSSNVSSAHKKHELHQSAVVSAVFIQSHGMLKYLAIFGHIYFHLYITDVLYILSIYSKGPHPYHARTPSRLIAPVCI